MQLALTEDDLAHLCESETLQQRSLSHTMWGSPMHTEMLRRNWYWCRCVALYPAVHGHVECSSSPQLRWCGLC